jgi:hypothetical protein
VIYWSAGAPSLRIILLLDPETLGLKGLKVAIITHVFSLQRKPGDTEWLRRIWREIPTLLDVDPWAEMKERVFLLALGGAYYR